MCVVVGGLVYVQNLISSYVSYLFTLIEILVTKSENKSKGDPRNTSVNAIYAIAYRSLIYFIHIIHKSQNLTCSMRLNLSDPSGRFV